MQNSDKLNAGVPGPDQQNKRYDQQTKSSSNQTNQILCCIQNPGISLC